VTGNYTYQAIWRLVKTVADCAGIPAEIGAHTLRRAYCDRLAKHAGLRSLSMRWVTRTSTKALFGSADA
jgi:site-specific recombinase XerD